MKSCAQIGKTDALVLNTIGYYMNYNPIPIMVLQPTLDMGRGIQQGKVKPDAARHTLPARTGG